MYIKSVTENPWVHGHLNDLLAGGLLAAYVYALVVWRFRISTLVALLVSFVSVVLAGAYWELVTPLYRSNSVYDVWDIVAYLLGVAAFACYLLGAWWILGNNTDAHGQIDDRISPRLPSLAGVATSFRFIVAALSALHQGLRSTIVDSNAIRSSSAREPGR